MRLRPASDTDLPQLAQLWQEYRVLLCQSDPHFEALLPDHNSWLHQISAVMADPECIVVAAEADDGLAGFIIARVLDDETGLVESLVLDAHRYHGGLGRELVRAMRAWLAQREVKRVFVRVPRHHAVEQAFWLSLGGREVEAVDKYHWMETRWKIPPEFMWITL